MHGKQDSDGDSQLAAETRELIKLAEIVSTLSKQMDRVVKELDTHDKRQRQLETTVAVSATKITNLERVVYGLLGIVAVEAVGIFGAAVIAFMQHVR